jgi:hypothetical protein
MSADGVELFCDLIGRPAGRPLENHMFDEMGQPALGDGFVASTDVDPYAHGDGSNVGYLFGDNLNTVGKDGFINHRRSFHHSVLL